MTLQVSECCFYGVFFRIFYILPEIFRKCGEHSIMPPLQAIGGFFVTF